MATDTEDPAAATATKCPECGMGGVLHDARCSARRVVEGAFTGETPPTLPNGHVDGKAAVIDGRTGGVLGTLLDEYTTTDSEVLSALTIAQEAESAARTEKNKAANAHTAAKKSLDAATAHAAEHYNRTRQLGLKLTVGGTEPGDDDGADDDGASS